jgi:ABC-type transport system involved in multi-copper enzyme maturation permease subunit
MVFEITKKEIHANLLSLRFPALIIITMTLFLINALLFAGKYEGELSSYSERIARYWDNRSTAEVTLEQRPNVLEFCVAGQGNISSLNLKIGGLIDPVLPEFGRNFTLPHFNQLDWTFIVKVLFSLFGIIFTFDAIAGEKEHRTLALICSNSVSRAAILLGKYFGAMVSLLAPLAIGMLLNLLTFSLLSGGTYHLNAEHFLRILGLVIFAVVYISLFVLLGLCISSSVSRSSTALLLLLSLWVILIIVVPNLAGIVTDYTDKIVSEYQISKQWREMWKTAGSGEIDRQIESGAIQTEEELQKAAQKVMNRLIDLSIQLIEQRNQSILAKRAHARQLASISPAALYQYANESLANTGFTAQQRFLRAIKNYYIIYEDYVRAKVGEIVKTSGWGFGQSRDFKGKSIFIGSPEPKRYSGDMSDFPRFTEPEISIRESISFFNLTVLLLWNLLLFLLAFLSFLRQDIR